MMLILSIHECGICFYLFVSSSVSYNFIEYMSFTSLVKFIPRYFILLVTIVNGIFSLVFLSDISLLVYKNVIYFWILTLYPATLPNSLNRLNSFLVESIGFSMYTIMSSANNNSFTSSFPIWMTFISFSCLIDVTRTSSTVLNKSGENGRSCSWP